MREWRNGRRAGFRCQCPIRAWRFNSSLAHHDGWSPDYLKYQLTRASALLSGGLSWTLRASRGLSFPTMAVNVGRACP